MAVSNSPNVLGPSSNPNFDPRILAMPPSALVRDPTLKHGNLSRGYLQTATLTGAALVPAGPGGEQAAAQSGGFFSLFFLYNPTEVDVSYSLNTSEQVTPAYLRSSADSGIPLVMSGGTLGFSLLFDRTYEVNYGSAGNMAHDLGVLVDTHALFGMTGITMPLSAAQGGTGTAAAVAKGTGGSVAAVSANAVVGVMSMLPVWAVFPTILGANYGQIGTGVGKLRTPMPDISLMQYFGYITSISIAYSHFTQRMIPFRCGVQIQMQLMSSAGWQ